MTDPPMSPEDWRGVIQNAITETGQGDDLIIQTETTMSGWRVVVAPPQQAPAAPDAS